MLRKLLLMCSMVGIGVTSACATQAGDAVKLHGRLTLRSNEPFVYPVIRDASGDWKLEGLARQDAAKLQNRVVRVKGTSVPVSGSVEQRAARVEAITVDGQ